MNREDIIRMAREAGFNVEQGYLLRITGIDEDLERFAALVASAERNRTWTQDHWTEYEHAIVVQEREACAELCEMLDVENAKGKSWDEGTIDCANAIRARRQA